MSIPSLFKIKKKAGFTLAEMAIVVLLIGIMMTMGVKMLSANLENAAYSETKSKQERIKIALINFMRTNGKLPCPEFVTVPGVALYGEEGRSVAGPAGLDSACKAFPLGTVPVVPWITLQLSRDDVVDGWGNFFTYRVANINTDARNWTSKTINIPFDLNQFTTPVTVFNVRERSNAVLSAPIPSAVVVLVSHGKNGLGARTVKSQINPPPVVGTDEETNAINGAINFVRRPISEDTAPVYGAFDDLIMYLTPQDLLQPLITEQTLKTSAGYCAVAPAPSACTGQGRPYSFCTGALAPVFPFACTAVGRPYSFCTGAGAPALPFSCTSAGVPFSSCTSFGTPASPNACTNTGVPYGFCTGPNTPVNSSPLLTVDIPVGVPSVFCP